MKTFLQKFGAKNISFIVFLFTMIIGKAQTPGDWQYATQAGGTNSDAGRGIATDGAGNSYVTGNFDLAATFYGSSNIVLNTFGLADIFLAKYDPAGNVLWAVQAGGKNVDQSTSLSLDNNGNTYITGYFYDTATFYGSSNIQLISNGSADVFIAKYDPSGNVLWAKKAGGYGGEFAYKIKADGAGNSYITGGFPNDSLVFYGTPNDTLYSKGVYDIFIAKFDVNGNVLWAKDAGGSGNDNAYGITVDGSGNVFVAGSFLNTCYFYKAVGKDSLTSIGSNDLFVAKYDANGNELWVRQGGSSLTDQASGVAVDVSGNCYIAGNAGNSCTFFAPPANVTIASNGLSDLMIASFDSSGNIRWAKHAGGANSEFGSSINLNASNHCSITGSIGAAAVTFYGSPNIILTSNGSSDLFIAEYDTAGNVLCAQSGGGTGFDKGMDISSDAAGNSYIAGQFNGSATFQATPTFTLTAPGSATSDVFIGKWLSSCTNTTGISSAENNYMMYPNPAEEYVSILSVGEIGVIRICNCMGETVLQMQSKNASEKFDVSQLPAGVYLVKTQGSCKKLIKL